ncbi:hypothetical protein Tco_0493886 [Tanacetum coccineum]
MPRECLKIIKSKSKVRQSRSKAIVSKVSTSSSTPAVSSDIADLKDMVRALILDKKNQTSAPAPVKAVEQSCVTCRGGHSYQNCPATDGNVYRDNIQEYVSQAAAVNCNQGNANYRPQMVANQIRPPVGDTKTFSYNIIESVNRVDVIDIACEKYVQEVLEIYTSDLMIDSHSPSFTPFRGSDFLMEEIDEFLEHDDSIPPGVNDIYDSEGDTIYLEELLSVINSDPSLPPSLVCEINVPEKMLENLAGNKYFFFLTDHQLLSDPIEPLVQENTTLPCPYRNICLSSSCLWVMQCIGARAKSVYWFAIFHDMIENTMKFMMISSFLVILSPSCAFPI